MSISWGLWVRRFSIAVIAAVSTVALTQIAFAADLPRKAPAAPPAPPPIYNWTGFYVGGNIGGGWANRDVVWSAGHPAIVGFDTIQETFLPPVSYKPSGVLGGIQLGYNWQFNPNWLIGLETDFDWSGVKGSGTGIGSLQGGAFPFTLAAEERIKWFGTVRARLGYLFTPSLLAYVAGGFAYGNVERSASYVNSSNSEFSAGLNFSCNPGAACFLVSSSDTRTGWTAGGGLEYAFWGNFSVKAEYLYIRLDNNSLFAGAVTGISGVGYVVTFNRLDLNVARVGLNYRF